LSITKTTCANSSSYTYDSMGNLLQMSITSGQDTDSRQFTLAASSHRLAGETYDANGNRISRTLTVAKVEEKGKSDDITTTLDFISEETNAFGGATVSIYPNPTHDKLTVSIQGLRENHVKACLIATTGAILIQQELCKDVHDLDLSSLPSGMYLLQLSASNMTQILKIIKE